MGGGVLLFLGGCAVAPTVKPVALPTPQTALSLIPLTAAQSPAFDDDADTATLREAALQSLTYYKAQPVDSLFTLAKDTYTAQDLADSMAYFVDVMDQAPTREAWKTAVRRQFQVYQSVGADPHQTVTFSAYYEPTISARLRRTATYRYPIYGRPSDLIDVDLGQFDPIYQGARLSGRRQDHHLVPYYTRGDIDSRHRIRRKAPVIAWAKNPADIFFLQIEGSGWLDVGRKRKLRVRYDGDNGRRYRSVGQYLIATGRIENNRLSHAGFERYLNDHPRDRQAWLNVDERYVFFRIDRSSSSAYAYGNLEVPLTAGRSVATDPKLFPKGLLGWMATDQPVLNEEGDVVSTTTLTRFVLNQDEGGAIQGPGRVDFFVGDARSALRYAVHFWQHGTLYFLVKKRGT